MDGGVRVTLVCASDLKTRQMVWVKNTTATGVPASAPSYVWAELGRRGMIWSRGGAIPLTPQNLFTMPEITWENDIPTPAAEDVDFFDELNLYEEDEESIFDDFNWVGSRHHYWFNQMIEIAAAYMVGQMLIGPNLIQTDYLNEDHKIVTVIEVVQEVDKPMDWR